MADVVVHLWKKASVPGHFASRNLQRWQLPSTHFWSDFRQAPVTLRWQGALEFSSGRAMYFATAHLYLCVLCAENPQFGYAAKSGSCWASFSLKAIPALIWFREDDESVVA